jgi:hypothetical protein
MAPASSEIHDIRPHWWMYRDMGGGEWGVCGDKRHFDERFSGSSRAEGLSAHYDANGAVIFESKLPDIKCAAEGDFLIFEEDNGSPVMIKISEIHDDPTTTLPYYEASGKEVTRDPLQISAILDGKLPPPPEVRE